MAAGPSRVLAFCLLSCFVLGRLPPLFMPHHTPPATLRPPHLFHSPPRLFPPFCVSVCLMSFVSLSGSSQTLRHLLPTDTPDRQTDRLAGDSITVAETGRGGEQCGGRAVEETDVQTDRAPTTGGWESLACQSRALRRRRSEISVESCFEAPLHRNLSNSFPKTTTF